MSDHLGPAGPAAPPPEGQEPEGTERPRRRRRWPYVVTALVVLVVAGGGVAWWQLDLGRYPARWDPRVQPYVDAAEKERGLEFEHPVHVDFLSAAEFRDQVTSGEKELTESDREELENSTTFLRTLGLVEGDLDLREALDELQGSGIVGVYDPDDERIRMRGTELTPAVRSTLVHELTHALQDQHFDIGDRSEELAEGDDDGATSAYDALVEGDANRVATAWAEGLDEEDRKAVEADQERDLERFEDESSEVPVVLRSLISSPYAFGEAMLAVAEQEGGQKAVDDLFRAPPLTEEHLLDPSTLVPTREKALEVATPRLASGEKRIEKGSFGAVGWLLTLAERLPPRQALTAAEGWGGDAYVVFRRGEVSCTRVAYRADTPKDLREMSDALTAFVARTPGGAASVERTGSGLLLESCDPGASTVSRPTGGSEDALTLAAGRTYLSAMLAQSGLGREEARCAGDRLVRAFTQEELNDPDVDPERVQRAMAPCLG